MHRKEKIAIWSMLAASILTAATIASAALSTSGTPSIVAHAKGPGGLAIDAKSSKVETQDSAEKVTFVADLTGMETGIALRDKHMREKYLEVGKFPKSTLVLKRADLKIPASGTSSGKAQGTLTLHGVTKPTDVTYTITKTATGYNVLGTFSVNLKDFQIEVPNYLGATVAPDVDVTVGLDLADK